MESRETEAEATLQEVFDAAGSLAGEVAKELLGQLRELASKGLGWAEYFLVRTKPGFMLAEVRSLSNIHLRNFTNVHLRNFTLSPCCVRNHQTTNLYLGRVLR